jgi:hypothetical protein
MKPINVKAKVENDASPELRDACRNLSEILYPLHPAIEISALVTMVCRTAVVYDIPKDAFIDALNEGYDTFKLMMAEGPMQ